MDVKRCWSKGVLSTILGLVILLAAVPASSVPAWMTRSGTIEHASVQGTGTPIYVDAVIVDKIKAEPSLDYLVVHESWSVKSRMVVLPPKVPSVLRPGQRVDVSGVMTRLPNGELAIADAHVIGYLSKTGQLLTRGGPLVKGILAPTPWPWKKDLTAEASTASAGTLSERPPGEPNSSPLDPPASVSR